MGYSFSTGIKDRRQFLIMIGKKIKIVVIETGFINYFE